MVPTRGSAQTQYVLKFCPHSLQHVWNKFLKGPHNHTVISVTCPIFNVYAWNLINAPKQNISA
jgi:hypothetical protein